MVAEATEGSGRLRVLVTRPSADAIPLANALQRRGFDVLLQPLLRIELEEGPPPDLAGVQALLFTSANGVRAFVRRSDIRTLPVFAVGNATASAATAERFLSVLSADGNVDDLADLVRQRLDPAGGRLVHIAGSAVAGDLAGALETAGFTVERMQLYTARQTEALDPAIHSALAAGAVDAVMFFSPRSAASFVSLVRDAALAEACGGIHALCLSETVAEALSPVSWRSIVVAHEPNEESLLATLEREVTDTHEPETPRPDTSQSDDVDDLLKRGNAAAVVERFGGIRPMAAKLGNPVTTVQGWRARGHIPENRIEEIRHAAAEHGIDLSPGADADAPRAEPAAEKPDDLPDSGSHMPATSTARSSKDRTEDQTAPTSATPALPTGSGSGVAWAALILAVVALAGVASYRYWSQFVGEEPKTPAALAARIDKLEAAGAADRQVMPKVDEIGQKLERLSLQVAKLPATGAGDGKALNAMTAEMDSLRSSIDSMSSKLAQAESSARSANADVKDAVAALRTELATLRGSLSDIDARVKAIEDRPPATGEKIAALAVAAGQLETAVDSGNPYDGAFNSLKALAAGDTVIEQTLAALEKSTRTGIPTVADLSRHFEEIAPSLMVPATDSAGGGWVETLRAKALSLVNMRPVGDAGDSSPVTRAERALAKNDLAAAVAALDGVPGLAVGWQEQAQSRLDADAALAAVRARIVERLAAETQTADSAGTAKRGTP